MRNFVLAELSAYCLPACHNEGAVGLPKNRPFLPRVSDGANAAETNIKSKNRVEVNFQSDIEFESGGGKASTFTMLSFRLEILSNFRFDSKNAGNFEVFFLWQREGRRKEGKRGGGRRLRKSESKSEKGR